MAVHEHAGRVNGRWFIPVSGSFGVRLAANGSKQVIWSCLDCDFRSSALPHHEVEAAGIDIKYLPILLDYSGQFGRCIVKGCESEDVELNHFAPQAIFGDEADDWPTGYLCVRHHREWGERTTPQLNGPRWKQA